MSESIQNAEALSHFSKDADRWAEAVRSSNRDRVNVSALRLEYVMSIAKALSACDIFVDVGCGAGELVCDIATLGGECYGIDFADEMLEHGRQLAAQKDLPNATFLHGKFEDFDLGKGKVNLISANGLVEYLSIDQNREFFAWASTQLTEDGVFTFSIRNRLYNLFSLNEFTDREVRAGTALDLLNEALTIARGIKTSEILDAVTPPPLETEAEIHPPTNDINVSVRHMFTPSQIAMLLKEAGFRMTNVYPCHIHPSQPALRAAQPKMHAMLSYALQEHVDELPHLITQSSALMIKAEILR